MTLKCSMYQTADDASSRNYVSVMSVLFAIRDGRWKEVVEKIRDEKVKLIRDELKKLLPGCTFSGTFERRSAAKILSYSKLMIIDMDVKNENVIKRLRKQLVGDPHVFSFFTSPSGGMKILYMVSSEDKHHRDIAFPQIKDWFEDNYDVPIDTSGKDICRLCFMSYDPDIYINESVEPFPVDVNKKPEIVRHSYNENNSELCQDLQHIFKVIKGWMGDKHYVKGHRNVYLHKMACNLNRAGLTKEQIMYVITSNHSISANMHLELDNTVKGVCSRNRHEFGSKPIYIKKSNSNKQSSLFKVNHETNRGE